MKKQNNLLKIKMNKSFLNYFDCLKLVKLGIKSDSGFYYNKRDRLWYNAKDLFLGMVNFESLYIPVYTDADLNEALPHKIIIKQKSNVDTYDLMFRKTRNGKYSAEYENQIRTSNGLTQMHSDTEVEVKCKMLLYLHKKNLLNN